MPEASLVLRNARVYLLAPRVDAALDVVDVLEARVAQELDGPRAAPAGLAVDGEGLVAVELDQALGELVQRDETRADVRHLVLVRLAHVEYGDPVAVLQASLELLDRDLRHLAGLGGLLRDAAELLVVDELCDRRVLAADRAVRVLAQLHLAEAHAEGVVEQEASDQGLPDPEYELDGLGGLDRAYSARQYPEHPALGAARDEAGGRRLGVEAAVARSLFGVEHARLALEAENRTRSEEHTSELPVTPISRMPSSA